MDRSFSTGTIFNNDVDAIVIQPDGRLLIGGDFFNSGNGEANGIVRLLPNGALDSSFTGSGAAQVRAVALQPDGKVLIGGYFTTVNGIPRVRIARLNADGSLDTDFDPGTGAVGTGYTALVCTIAVQSDGKILIGGDFDTVNGVARRSIARLLPNGNVDTSFNAGTVSGTFAAQINKIIYLSDEDKILVGGYYNSIGGSSYGGIAKLNGDGSLDNSFSPGSGTNGGVRAIAVQSDGKMLISGFFTSVNGVAQNKIARLQPDGTLDTTFVSAVDDPNIGVYDVASLPSKKVFIVGNFDTVGGVPCAKICRLSPSGAIDRSFKLPYIDPVAYVYAVALSQDNKPVVGGSFTSIGFVSRRRLARLANDQRADFDGDAKADLSIFRPAVGEWYYERSTNGVVNGVQFGSSSDKSVAADFTGDGRTDIAFFSPSTNAWYILRSENFTYYAFPFGAAGDIPVTGDFDGDGLADAAVYRPSAQTWFILKSTGGVLSVPFGLSGDVPVPADYDGDGKADVAIYRPSVGQWWFLRSSNGSVFAATFGNSADKPTPGDFTGDGKADIAFFRPGEGSWYVLRSEDQTYYAFPFGNSTDKPAPADFDGDGKYDAAVFRPSDTNWYILRSTGGVTIQQFGLANDTPVPGQSIP